MAKLLIVDDERSVRRTLAALAENAGHTVHTADSVSGALALLDREEIDVIVSDIGLGLQSGLDLLPAVLRLGKRVQVIIMTGTPSTETAVRALRGGAIDYLAKPLRAKAFLEAVSHAAKLKEVADERAHSDAINKDYCEELYELLSKRTRALDASGERLRETIGEALMALARTVELREPEAAGHQVRVAELGQAIAKELGLADETVRAVYMTGIVHDLGKLRIPDRIIEKPGPLNTDEIQLVRAHPMSGYEVLRIIEFPWPLADIELQHHERLDGSGYPRGLKGAEIEVAARILAVADVVEAIPAARPYRAARPLTVALEEIEAKSGVLYDPDAAEACVRLLTRDGFRFSR